MFKRNDDQHTPKQLAERAVMRMLARLGACCLLIYFMVKLLIQTSKDAPGTHAPVIIAVVLMTLSVVVIAITIYELVRGVKNGLFDAATYEAADIANYLATRDEQSDDSEQNDNDTHSDPPSDQNK